MSTRQAKKVLTGITREAADEAFANYNRCISNLEQLQGKMNSELTTVKEKYEGKISVHQEEKDGHFEVMQAYAEANPELFIDKKSIETTHGVYGFRTGMPKLSPRKGYKWPAVFEMVKEKFIKYIRTKEEVDKESMLADRNTIDLKSVGLEVTQDETFYVQPNLEQVANV